MVALTLEEAQLYRMLVSLFGADRIVPHMSFLAVCGGQLPSQERIVAEMPPNSDIANLPAPKVDELAIWAKRCRCLFTLIDADDTPKLVLEFAAINNGTIEAEKLRYQELAQSILPAAGVRFLTIQNDEFEEMLDPTGNLDLFTLLKKRFEELGFSFGSPTN